MMRHILFLSEGSGEHERSRGDADGSRAEAYLDRAERWIDTLLEAGHAVHWWRADGVVDRSFTARDNHRRLRISKLPKLSAKESDEDPDPEDPTPQDPTPHDTVLDDRAEAMVVQSLALAEKVCRWPIKIPVWVDLGWDLPDAESKLDGHALFESWWRFDPILDRADVLSGRLESQRDVLLALAGWRGRLHGGKPDYRCVQIVKDRVETSEDKKQSLEASLLMFAHVPERAAGLSSAVRADHVWASLLESDAELKQIKRSKMWRLWMFSIHLRRNFFGMLGSGFKGLLLLPFRLVGWGVRSIVRAVRSVLGRVFRLVGSLKLLFQTSVQGRVAAFRRRFRSRRPPMPVVDQQPELPASWPVERRPRLLIVSPYSIYPPNHGGGVRLYNLVQHLSKSLDVYMLIFDRAGGDLAQKTELERFCRQVFFHRWEPNFTKPRGQVPPNIQLFSSEKATRKITDLIKTHQIDVVQIEYTELASYLDATVGVPTILVEHDVAFHSFNRRRSLRFADRFPGSEAFGSTRLDGRRLQRFEVQSCRKADQIHVMSPHDGAYLASFLSDGIRRMRVVPNAVDTAYYRPKDLAAPRSGVLLVGNFENLPNLDAFDHFVENIWPEVRRLVPEATLSVVGAKMPDRMKVFDGRDGITIVGRVEDMRPSYHQHRVLVVPLRAGSGTRLKLFEAFAAGIPAVSTPLGAEGIDYEPETHLLIASDRPRPFARAVKRLLEDDALHAKLQREAMRLAEEHYDWRFSADENLRGIYELLARVDPPTRPLTALETSHPRSKESGQEEPRRKVHGKNGSKSKSKRKSGEAVVEADEETTAAAVDISVVIPTLNGGELFAACLQAISEQKIDRTFEVLCVDSGSRQEDLDTMKRFGVRVHAIDKKDFNHGLTRDLGAQLARGEVLVFLNQDAVPGDEYWLQHLTEPLFGFDPPAAVQGGMLEFPHDNGKVRRFFWDSCGERFYFTRESESWIERYDGIGFSTVNAALSREVWEEIPFGWAPIMEDKKWQREIVERNYEIVIVPEAVVYHTHDYDLRSLSRRCESEGMGWQMLGEKYSFKDMLSDMMKRRIYGEWLRGLRQGRIRKPAEFVFPWLRPWKLYVGNQWSRQVKL